MQTVRITTTQNVEIEYEVASIGDRILAGLVDGAVWLGYVIGAALLLFEVLNVGDKKFGIALTVALYLPAFLYDLLCESLMDGQSLGKKLLKIKVIKLDGSPPDFGSYLLRWLLRWLDVTICWGGIAILTILINGRGQRLGDLAAGTTVIKLKPGVGFRETIFADLEQDYRPVFPQAAQLNDKDIAIVKEVLDASLDVQDAGVGDALELKAKTVLTQRMGIASDLHPRAFLATILKDYNYFKGRA